MGGYGCPKKKQQAVALSSKVQVFGSQPKHIGFEERFEDEDIFHQGEGKCSREAG